jgi:hypothetical protein
MEMKEYANQWRNAGLDRSSSAEGLAANSSAQNQNVENNAIETASARNIEETVKAFRRYSFDDNGGGYLGL